MIIRPDGPATARLMIVGEAPGFDEERTGVPFCGASGQELNRMLHEAGMMRSEAFVTNVCRIRPPSNDISAFFAQSKKAITKEHLQLRDRWVLPPVWQGYQELKREIESVNPNIIIALGNTALWALTGKWGILKWRGSMLTEGISTLASPPKVIPAIHPAAILREWKLRAVTIHDFRRAALYRDGRPYPKPEWQFHVRPTFQACLNTLSKLNSGLDSGLYSRISFDLETRAGHIACAGISWSLTDAISIPFMCVERQSGYFSEAEEAEIVWLLRRVLCHPKAKVIGQNLLYDCQYTHRHWLFIPRVYQDTMIGQHSIFSDLPKNLGFIASMYCRYYYYWKDEGKNWDPKMGEDQLWYYNMEDCVYTDEAGLGIESAAKSMGLWDVYLFQQKMLFPVLKAMLRGVRIDTAKRNELLLECQEELQKREQFLVNVLGHSLNPRSPDQMKKLFYEDLKLPIQMTRAKKGQPSRPTLDDDALQKLGRIEPLVRPILNCIADIRTLGVFISNFLTTSLDVDGRMRCAYNIGGSESGKSAPKTYRLSSSESAFGSGGNLQNIPAKSSKSIGKAKGRGESPLVGDALTLPNLREMFIPDQEHTLFNGDLDRADLQVVCWECGDEMLKAALKMGTDIHLMNSYSILGKDPPPLEELIERHKEKESCTCGPRCYWDYRRPMNLTREFAKVFCHGCVDDKHEALTPQGWVKVSEITDDIEILICNADGSGAKFERPRSWWSGPCNSDMIYFEGESVNQCVTSDHRMPFKVDERIRVTIASNLPASARLPKSVKFDGPLIHPNPKLLAAFHADGSIDSYGNVTFHLIKDRKISRLRRRLTIGTYTAYEGEDGSTTFYLSREEAKAYGLTSKKFLIEYLQWSHKTAVDYLEEQVFWDGHQGKTSEWMSSIDGNRAELVHTLSHMHNFGSQLNYIDRPNKKRLYRWSLNHRTWWRLASVSIKYSPALGRKVYCPVTSTGFWLTRREGKISATGNTNYGGGARTMAAHTGRTVAEIERAQRIWFGAHPGIKLWHDRVKSQVTSRRYVENKFGYRWYIFDRVDAIIPEAIAWIPQSTVSIVINKIWMQIYEQLPEVEVLLQVHDSLVGQFRTERKAELVPRILELAKITVPYEDPLVIPFSLKTSEVSWGECG